MLLNCRVSRQLCSDINVWIKEMGMLDFHLSNTKFLIGDLETECLQSIPLSYILQKGMKKEQKLHILSVKNNIKNYFQKKYRYYRMGRKRVFDKDDILLPNLPDKNGAISTLRHVLIIVLH